MEVYTKKLVEERFLNMGIKFGWFDQPSLRGKIEKVIQLYNNRNRFQFFVLNAPPANVCFSISPIVSFDTMGEILTYDLKLTLLDLQCVL